MSKQKKTDAPRSVSRSRLVGAGEPAPPVMAVDAQPRAGEPNTYGAVRLRGRFVSEIGHPILRPTEEET